MYKTEMIGQRISNSLTPLYSRKWRVWRTKWKKTIGFNAAGEIESLVDTDTRWKTKFYEWELRKASEH